MQGLRWEETVKQAPRQDLLPGLPGVLREQGIQPDNSVLTEITRATGVAGLLARLGGVAVEEEREPEVDVLVHQLPDSVRGEEAAGDVMVEAQALAITVATALPAFSSSNGRRRQWPNRFSIAP